MCQLFVDAQLGGSHLLAAVDMGAHRPVPGPALSTGYTPGSGVAG